MSDLASRYYAERAADLEIEPMPPILDGRPVALIAPDETPSAELLADRFCEHVRPVEPYVLHGILGVYEARNRGLKVPEWESIRRLPRYSRTLTIERYAAEKVAASLAPLVSPSVTVRLEAVIRDEVPKYLFNRATRFDYAPRAPEEESAQAFFMTRVTAGEWLLGLHFTLLWASHRAGILDDRRRRYGNHLTPRYLGVAPLKKEMQYWPDYAGE